MRDIYEPVVIYSFLALILEYCGGEQDCVYQIENESAVKMPFPLCFLAPRPRDARLLRYCKKGCLQFIVAKPTMAVLTVVMIATGLVYNPIFVTVQMIVYNVSYSVALYSLFVFYLSTKQILQEFRPILKFATVKLIIFATYYQSIGVLAVPINEDTALKWNDLFLCLEMVLFSLLLMLAFPVAEYRAGIPEMRVLESVKEVLTVRDVFQDMYHNYHPTYQDYALQRSECEAPEQKKTRTRLAGNLNSVAAEMQGRYRGRNRRFEFNSLLRGSRPISAHLRSEDPSRAVRNPMQNTAATSTIPNTLSPEWSEPGSGDLVRGQHKPSGSDGDGHGLWRHGQRARSSSSRRTWRCTMAWRSISPVTHRSTLSAA